MTFRCVRCEYPGYHEVPDSSLVRCARCTLVQPRDIAVPAEEVNAPEPTDHPHRIPRRWRAIPRRRTVEKAVLLGGVVVAGGLAGFTTELVMARPRPGLSAQEVTASPKMPAMVSADSDAIDFAAEDRRIARRLREAPELAGRAAEPRLAEGQSGSRISTPAEPESVPRGLPASASQESVPTTRPADSQPGGLASKVSASQPPAAAPWPAEPQFTVPVPRQGEAQASVPRPQPVESRTAPPASVSASGRRGLPSARPDLPQLPWTSKEASSLETERSTAELPPPPDP
jgi:hypothetical protein